MDKNVDVSSLKPKTSSIIWQINGNIQWSKLRKFLFWDLIFVLCSITGACAAVEAQYGPLKLMTERSFSWNSALNWQERLRSMEYQFLSSEKVQTVPIGSMIWYAMIVAGILFAVQLLGWILDWTSQNHRLRRYMRPIDELALTAEKLSREGINEESIQNLEIVIDQMSVSESSISTGDQDLQGLETAINNLLKRLQASYREQTRFVDDASHELRTPIAVIQGYASMLQRWGMDDRKTLEEAVAAINEESAHMKELVDQLLFLARGDGGRQQFHEKKMNATELIKEVCEESEMIDHKHRYHVISKCEECEVYADYAMLKQAVRILVDNAVKYTKEGGTITLRVEKVEDNFVGIGVQDEGIGMEAEEAAHMFERFFRGEEVRGTTKGSGLGLSIAKWIVEHHHGRIRVISYKEIGTRMTILLPEYLNKKDG